MFLWTPEYSFDNHAKKFNGEKLEKFRFESDKFWEITNTLENKVFWSKWTETPFFCWRRKQFVHSCRNSFSKNSTIFHPKSQKSYQTTLYARKTFLLKIYFRQLECSFVETAENFPTNVWDFQQTSCIFINFKVFFPSEIFSQIIHLNTLNAALTTLRKVRWKKLMRFCYESVKSWRFTKTFKTKVFAQKMELTIFPL